MYVWFDALTNYLTALGLGESGHETSPRVETFWPTVTHLVGKEIIRQHALYWPAFLMSAGLTPPRRIIAHGWWLMGGAKMSKSVGNVARYQDYVGAFGLDALRYFVMREMPLGLDANFSDEGMLARFNADLANDLGNLVSRATTMVHRYRSGIVPAPPADARTELDAALERDIARTIASVRQNFEQFQITVALQETWELVRALNKYIVEREPWALAKQSETQATLDVTLYHAADGLRVIAALVDPVMPGAAARIRVMLGIDQERWSGLAPGTLAAGTRLGPIEPLFPRIEKSLEELRAMSTDGSAPNPQPTEIAATPNAPAPVASQPPAVPAGNDARISIDDFLKVELRTARVLEAEAVPKSKKLLKLTVDVGSEQRTVLAGIAEAYQPEQLVGRTIAVVFNLKPAKLMGIESNGMVLAASPEGGKPTLITFEAGVEPGWRVR
jgi:methionyl-tRNA synthetase